MWWGHPITTGSLQIDYFLGLDYEIKAAGGPEDETGVGNHYSEQLVRLDYMSTASFVPVSGSYCMLVLVVEVKYYACVDE